MTCTGVVVEDKHVSVLPRSHDLHVLEGCVCFENDFVKVVLNQTLIGCGKVARNLRASTHWRQTEKVNNLEYIYSDRLGTFKPIICLPLIF